MQIKYYFLLIFTQFLCFCTQEKIRTDAEQMGLSGKVKHISSAEYKAYEHGIDSIVAGTKHYELNSYFGENGNHIRDEKIIFRVGSDAVVSVTFFFTHCPAGRKIESHISVEGEPSYLASRYTYNKHGNLTEETVFGRDGTIELTSSFTYDNNGRMKERKSKNADGSLSSLSIYTYDNDMKVPSEEHITYNEEISYLTEAHYICKYEFDDRGNWILRLSYIKDGPGKPYLTYMQRRQIEYYP